MPGVQEVEAILSKALPEYQWKAHGQGEKRQFCDNSKVWDSWAKAGWEEHAGSYAVCQLQLNMGGLFRPSRATQRCQQLSLSVCGGCALLWTCGGLCGIS